MRLYGVIQDFRLGRMPSNEQIDQTLKYVVNNSPIDESKLSSEGRELTQDVRDIIETARLIVQRKNADELFQNFMWSTRHIDTSTVKKDPNEVIPVDGEKVAQDKDQGMYLVVLNFWHRPHNRVSVQAPPHAAQPARYQRGSAQAAF